MKSKQEIFDALISENLGVLRAAAYRILGNPAEVDDAVQDSLLIAWQKYSQFRSGAKLSSWVCRITINHCCDLLRKRQRETQKLKKFIENSDNTTPPCQQEQLETLTAAIAELPEMYREAIVIGVLTGDKAETAAETLGCSANTLYQRIHTAKKMLKTKLGLAI